MTDMLRKNSILFSLCGACIGVSLIALWVFYGSRNDVPPSLTEHSENISVVTTLFPVFDCVKAIGGNHVHAALLLPPGVDAHSFEPRAADILRMNTAHLFVYTGKSLEPWTADLLKGTSSSVRVVDASAGITLLSGKDEHGEETGVHENEGREMSGEPRHGGFDPHIWLDFDNMATMAKTIARALSEQDPDNASDYEKNLSAYVEKLSALDARYRESLASCRQKTIVYGGHSAFEYLARRYGLRYEAAQGFSPDAEPSARDITALVNMVRAQKHAAIFYEELLNPKIAQAIARETGADMLPLRAAHNISKDEYALGTTFLSIMEENRKSLVQGLECPLNGSVKEE